MTVKDIINQNHGEIVARMQDAYRKVLESGGRREYEVYYDNGEIRAYETASAPAESESCVCLARLNAPGFNWHDLATEPEDDEESVIDFCVAEEDYEQDLRDYLCL